MAAQQYRDGETDVLKAQWTPPKRRILSGCGDRTLKIWSMETCEEVLTRRGHCGAVESVAFSPDGTRIASGSKDGTVKVWETKAPPPDVLRARDAPR